MLIRISDVTGCSIDWLLTGKVQEITPGTIVINERLLEKLKAIAREQAQIVYGDVEIAGDNIDDAALRLPTEFLLSKALASYSLIADGDVMSPADRKSARRFTFADNVPESVDEVLRKMMREEMARAGENHPVSETLPPLLRKEGSLRKTG
jgi:hypothetical protein